MSNEFYDFIAKKIDSYFQSSSKDGLLLKGESFCLKLDNEDMVEKVYKALKKLAISNNTIGDYSLTCKDDSIYNTFTLKLEKDEIIIAAQIDDMTNDFLCATIRNAANEKYKPLLMISANPIDSAKSGSQDMAASGMPFYSDELIKEIKKLIEISSQLSEVEKRILYFELKRRDADVFSDNSSLYEYKDLLSILSSGRIQPSNYQGFRLFSLDGKTDYIYAGKSKIEKEIKNNNELFERIERGIRYGNLESDLSKILDDSMIYKIEKAYKDDPEKWSIPFKYADLLASIERKKAKMDNPLQIDNENISLYGSFPFEMIDFDKDVLIRNEGSQTSHKRVKHFLVFNSCKYKSLHLRVDCNTKIYSNNIVYDDTTFEKDGKAIIFTFDREGISFHKLELFDDVNNIRYIFKICIIDICSDYLLKTVKTSFIIDYKKTKKKCRIKIPGVSTLVEFNTNGISDKLYKLEDNALYKCSITDKLILSSTEDDLSNYGSGINIEIDFSGIVVPFVFFPDEPNSKEIIGRNIFKEKFSQKKCFIYEDGRIRSETNEFFVKAQLSRELKLESIIIDKKILCGKIKNNSDPDTINVDSIDLCIPLNLKEAYVSLLNAFNDRHTTPTLAYVGGDLRQIVESYINAFEECFIDLSEGDVLTKEQEDVLLLGALIKGNYTEIIYTPFHPLNMVYQLSLIDETGFKFIGDVIIDRLNSINLLPYIQRLKKIYKVSDQIFSQEWKYYAPVENKKYRGSRRYVSKLVEEKIIEFSSHFKYIFDDINNRSIKINLINMGDCTEVFIGITNYFIHEVNKNAHLEKLLRFEIHIYNDDLTGNAFKNIKDYYLLKRYLEFLKLSIASGTTMNTLEGILSKNVSCYFHHDTGLNYEYAHLTFYEMESEILSEQATMNQIETGISLHGILSGIPSSKYGHKYRTGYGIKYAENNRLINISSLYNALMQVESTGNPYHSSTCISTQIQEQAEKKMDYIYKDSNWVVFVDPKVDLDFFTEKETNSDLLIIHYSDQYTSSSGYDAITVTHKSNQYAMVIKDYLYEKGIFADVSEVHKIIDLFNAINGDWLLRLVSSKRGNKDSTFSREKISIVAAIKFMLAFLRHKDIIWIPISLEEMLRVSGGVGLSRDEGVLSAKNLGFDMGPTSDDLLFIGLDYSKDIPKLYLYPTEVKTGNNEGGVIKKAFEQISSTARGFHDAFIPDGTISKTLLYKVNRNFLMQLLITSAKKMQSYHVDDSQCWHIILDKFREALLNDNYVISDDIQEILGKGAVLSFRSGVVQRKTSFKEDSINYIEMPEKDEFDLILKDVNEIYVDICNKNESELLIFGDCNLAEITGDLSKLIISEYECDESDNVERTLNDNVDLNDIEEINSNVEISDDGSGENLKTLSADIKVEDEEYNYMRILFGKNEQNGEDVFWCPNDTTQLFHTNTGIIGTMGTGKTQFTKSLITQICREQENNVDGQRIGILIFDYKGDYNESKLDFVQATNAKILKPYHLPFNPLTLTKSKVFKPLLPTHTANAFKDTISKVYNLGPKQQACLLQCIMDTYISAGINPANQDTWNYEAPTFDQVYQRYCNDEDIKKGDSLSAALDKLGMFEIFESDPKKTQSLFDILDGVVVIDLSGYDSDVQSLIIAITLDLFYSQMQALGSSKMEGNYRQLSKMILVDEADNFMSEGFTSLKKILKEGREFGVGTILSTQFLRHFGSGEDDYAKYILTWIVHNVSDLKNSDIDFVFNTEAKSQENQRLFNAIKGLEKHHSIIKIGKQKPIYLKDKPFWELLSDISS